MLFAIGSNQQTYPVLPKAVPMEKENHEREKTYDISLRHGPLFHGC